MKSLAKSIWIVSALLAAFFIFIAILTIGPRQDDHIFIVITAWSTAILAVGTLIAMMYQAAIARRASELALLMTLSDQWDSARMRETRKLVAHQLRVGASGPNHEAAELLDFFESVALFVNRGYMDIELVDSQFGWSILECWAVVGHHVEDIRKRYRDPIVYCELEALVRAIRERLRGDPITDAELKISFLKSEPR